MLHDEVVLLDTRSLIGVRQAPSDKGQIRWKADCGSRNTVVWIGEVSGGGLGCICVEVDLLQRLERRCKGTVLEEVALSRNRVEVDTPSRTDAGLGISVGIDDDA